MRILTTASRSITPTSLRPAFRVGIEGNDIPLGASVSLFMMPILAVAAIFILRDINKRGNES